ncbi:MAG: pilus assembly protein [Deltaproteobacteria bacterium]|nr:MAG: pilus assembly protein [Deltaproteobacteria bacterium]
MIVVAIAGLLAVFGILQFQNYRVRSYNAASLNDLCNVQHQLAAYYSDNGQYPW